jgi:hypothetical protein
MAFATAAARAFPPDVWANSCALGWNGIRDDHVLSTCDQVERDLSADVPESDDRGLHTRPFLSACNGGGFCQCAKTRERRKRCDVHRTLARTTSYESFSLFWAFATVRQDRQKLLTRHWSTSPRNGKNISEYGDRFRCDARPSVG